MDGKRPGAGAPLPWAGSGAVSKCACLCTTSTGVLHGYGQKVYLYVRQGEGAWHAEYSLPWSYVCGCVQPPGACDGCHTDLQGFCTAQPGYPTMRQTLSPELVLAARACLPGQASGPKS